MFSTKSCPLLGNYPDALDYKDFSAELFLPTCCLQRQNNSEGRSEPRRGDEIWSLEKETLQTQTEYSTFAQPPGNKGEDDCDFESFVQVEFLAAFNFTVGSLICQQQNLTSSGRLSSIFNISIMKQWPCCLGKVQLKTPIYSISEKVNILKLKYQGMYQMHIHLSLIDWESNPVLKWDLLLSWAIIHRQGPILIRSCRRSEKNI